jgi:hypothetical protein
MARTSCIKWWWSLLWTWPNTLSWIFYSASSLKQQSAGRHVTRLRHIILILSQSFCSYSLILCVQSRSSKYQFHIIWFDLTRVPALDLLHLKREWSPIYHRCGYVQLKDKKIIHVLQWRWHRWYTCITSQKGRYMWVA